MRTQAEGTFCEVFRDELMPAERRGPLLEFRNVAGGKEMPTKVLRVTHQ